MVFVVIKEIFKYLLKTKKWWLIPFVLLLVIIALLLILSTISPIPVFIYPLV
ncbi:MAG: DUF5989 family protein [Candidatus Aenigmatarchaeota archaeon]